MDENEHHKEVFAYFGLAMFTAQVLEHAIVNALVISDLIPNRRDKAASQESWNLEVDQFMDGHFENTMARLIKAFRKVAAVSKKLEQNLSQSLQLRNFLVHRYFRERDAVWLTEKGRDSMIAELQEASELFKKTDDLIEEIATPLRYRYGIADEALNRIYDERRAEKLKKANY